MEDPKLYREVSNVQKRDASLSLEEFGYNGRWKENARVIDIGCGDGSTNKEILQKYLPANWKRIVGSDVSQNMIDYASQNFGGDRVEFVQWDVCREVPLHLRNAFDHAFSFYTLHWAKDQKAAFSNIYITLAKGGNCLLMFLGRYLMFEVFRTLSGTKKWAEDLKDVEMFTSPYHDSKDPENDVLCLMKSVGFKDAEVKVLKNTYNYDTEVFKGLVKAVNPFHILNKRWDEFIEDYFAVAPNAQKMEYHLIDPENEVLCLMKSVGFKDAEVKVLKNTYNYDTEVFKGLVKAVNPFHILNKRWDEFIEDYFAVAPNAQKMEYHLIVAYGSK